MFVFMGVFRANLTENFRLLPGPMSSFIATGAQELCWFAVDRVFFVPAAVEVGRFSVIYPNLYMFFFQDIYIIYGLRFLAINRSYWLPFLSR